jgi:hypothetical protein
VPDVQNVEAPVGENDPLALAPGLFDGNRYFASVEDTRMSY